MTRVTGNWIKSSAAQSVCRAIASAGHQVFFVGGCVRNDLLNAPISDLDLSTDAHPERVIEIATSAGLRAVPTGIEHGTITIVADGIGLEVTTFRKDIETDGRRAVVAFADNIEDDARRRDFTMNALYATPSGAVVDPLGGLCDLRERRVKFIDDAESRIREDYLRTLRFFRFHAWYGDQDAGIDPDGLAAVSANLDGLETLSKERVGAEMLKLLSAPNPSASVASMTQSGVLATILPGADATNLPVLVHLEEGGVPDPIRRLALLGGEAVSDRLRLSKNDQKRLKLLREQMGTLTAVDELAYRHGFDVAMDVALLRASQMGSQLDDGLQAEVQIGAAAQFPVRASDLTHQYYGPALGAKLRELEAEWIASGFELTREELLK